MEFADGPKQCRLHARKIIQQLSLFQSGGCIFFSVIEFCREDRKKSTRLGPSSLVRPVARAPRYRRCASKQYAGSSSVAGGSGVGFNPRLPHGYKPPSIWMSGANVIVRDGAVSAIIDFDGSAYSPLRRFASRISVPAPCFASRGEEGLRDYLAEYEKVRPPDEGGIRETLPHVISGSELRVGHRPALPRWRSREEGANFWGLERRIHAIGWPPRGVTPNRAGRDGSRLTLRDFPATQSASAPHSKSRKDRAHRSKNAQVTLQVN